MPTPPTIYAVIRRGRTNKTIDSFPLKDLDDAQWPQLECLVIFPTRLRARRYVKFWEGHLQLEIVEMKVPKGVTVRQ